METAKANVSHRAAVRSARKSSWHFIKTGKGTGCAHGGAFGFWARLTPQPKLLIFFQGGGGCFSYRTCLPGSGWFDPSVNGSDDPRHFHGILDPSEPQNPFRGWSTVFIPSCAGDVFIGSGDHTYHQGKRHLTVHYRGWANAEAALTWTFKHVHERRQVFITGESAGSVGSAFHAARIIEHYRSARIGQLGDSLALLSATPLQLTEYHGLDHLPSWLKGDPQLRPGRFTMAAFLLRLMKHYPAMTFARFNFAADQVQERFYAADGGNMSTFPAALRQAEETLKASSRRYRSFLACGSGHTILGWRRFYSFVQQGISLRTWVNGLANGTPLRSTECRRK